MNFLIAGTILAHVGLIEMANTPNTKLFFFMLMVFFFDVILGVI